MAEDSKKLDTIVDAVHSIDVRLAGMDSKLDVLGLTSSDHETRMRVIERRLWMLAGAAAAVGSAGGSVVSQILK